MPSIEPQFFASLDGTRLAWRETGEGRPVVLLHGYFSDAQTNWIRYGHAAAIAARGFRVIMPDLRAHGSSAKPHDAASYPRDVLARDGMALIAHLGLRDYDLGGYSLGARTAVRMVLGDAMPRRLIISGMGLDGLMQSGRRAAHFRHILTHSGSFAQGTPEWLAEAFLKTTGGDPVALLRVLDSFVDSSQAEIAAITQPALVLNGADDQDNGLAAPLAAILPNALNVTVPGTHMSAVIKPELGAAMADFLAA